MIWVAVCDRDPQRRQQTGRLAARYLENRRGVSGRVALFANSDEMGRCGQLRFDICLMNVEAPLHLEAGKELRRRCPETALLYYSSTQDPAWALEAFRAGASQYLPYPLEERSLWLAMDRAAWERDLGRESRIALNSTQGVVNLRLWDITYARSRGHRITFSLLEGEDLETKCLRVSFATVLAPLEPKGFPPLPRLLRHQPGPRDEPDGGGGAAGGRHGGAGVHQEAGPGAGGPEALPAVILPIKRGEKPERELPAFSRPMGREREKAGLTGAPAPGTMDKTERRGGRARGHLRPGPAGGHRPL